jgi:hypothetical protein
MSVYTTRGSDPRLFGAWTPRSLVPAAEATQTDLEEFQRLYPNFQLEDELLLEGGEMSLSALRILEGGVGSRAPTEA